MNIPTQYGVNVSTPDPVQIKIDVSERTMATVGFVVIVTALLIKRIKG
ncbi:hypothetical protein AB6E39_00220 [Vibrio splendidus]|nr:MULTISPECIES: hypothetical protein [Vibrio]MCC4786640.1 hypothetical protein [Vibrio splendidus]CAK1847435.1 IPTL-CTERM sorting domain-containing protein [Vibrio crassostreae]CAK2488867.1 IPTL-CTERM sorting domain-containing protein [Vibrio crassostreae]CAK3580343.1 IPTL-CTERM sorting domain-containing protein [Vibrio crassostreae]